MKNFGNCFGASTCPSLNRVCRDRLYILREPRNFHMLCSYFLIASENILVLFRANPLLFNLLTDRTCMLNKNEK